MSEKLSKSDYLHYRDSYTPAITQIIFVLESPPASGLYFYNPEGSAKEWLFKAMMKDVLEIEPRTKEEGLEKFAAAGFLIVDATYTPVNDLDDDEADAIILRDFPLLIQDLRKHAGSKTRIVLVKANVCRILEPKLRQAGFNVLNQAIRIPFPSTGQQNKFRVSVRAVLGL